MSTTIVTRLYDSRDKAHAVVAGLKQYRFGSRDIDIIGGDGAQPMDAEAAKLKLAAAGVPKAAHGAVAGHVAEGKTALVIRAAFGKAGMAMEVADEHAPLDVEIPYAEAFDEGETGDGTQLYKREPGNVLLKDGTVCLSSKDVGQYGRKNPTPFSSLFKIPLLSKKGGKAKLISEKHFTGGLLWNGRFSN
ncbi:MAG: hypothetical protein NXI16_14755 [Alphaproteobacteria bacterium]|nr:hypothetical protein [Alphaproteobacteria bacterium]